MGSAEDGIRDVERSRGLGDVYKRQAHIYNNHAEQLKLQLSRELRPLPKMKMNASVKNIEDFSFEDFELVDYNPHPHIKGKVAI